MSERNRKSIPDRWLNCPRKADGLIADLFLAFKTPLSSEYNSQVPEANRFTPVMLIKSVQSIKKEIGLWFDLTNTSRFYDKAEIEKYGCKYVKLKCRGHGETPSVEQIDTFLKITKKYISQNPDKLIGVHCTHGFNRTGFFLIIYMIEELNFSLDAAIMYFARKRPPGIYKQDYLDELCRRYDEMDLNLQAPPRPAWCLEEEVDYDDDEVVDNNEDYDDEPGYSQSASRENPKRGRNKKQKQIRNKEFMAGVEGVSQFHDMPRMEEVQKKAISFCKWDKDEFPGSQPVSMDMKNIHYLQQKRYKVSWKADGVRYMMLIDGENEVYMLDRDNCVFKVHDLHFLHNKLNRALRDTLLDGELVIDVDIQRNIRKVRYLIYDIIRFENMNVGKEPFCPVRLKCIENEIIKPRERAIESGYINKDRESFRVGLKQFWDVSMAKHLLEEKFARTLTHEPDGLIFQPADDPYTPGPSPYVLKWKPSDMNSIDFKLRITRDERPGMVPRRVGQLLVGRNPNPFAEIKVNSVIKNLDGKIIECKFENNQWVFMRERTDKSFPNGENTAKAVLQSILNPVTKEYLLHLISEKMRSQPKRQKIA